MFAFGRDDVRGVDGIPFVVAIGPVIWLYVEVKSFVRSIGDDVAFVHPAVVVGGVVVFHQADEGALRPGVGTVECARADDGIVHAIEAVLYLAYYGSPIAEVINIRIDFGKSHFFSYFIELGHYPFGQVLHCTAEVFPVDKVLGATTVEVAACGVDVAV